MLKKKVLRKFFNFLFQGDSGSAVIYKLQVAGVISVQIPVSKGQSPVLMTKVFDHIEWINKIINKV